MLFFVLLFVVTVSRPGGIPIHPYREICQFVHGLLHRGLREKTLNNPNPNAQTLMGVSENLGVLIIRTLLFKVLYLDPLFSETPLSYHSRNHKREDERIPEGNLYDVKGSLRLL